MISSTVNGFFTGSVNPDATLAGCIDVYENIWPDPSLTIQQVEQECTIPYSGVSWSKAGTIQSGIFQEQRTNYDLSITSLAESTGNDVMKNIHNQMQFLLLSTSIPYARKHGISSLSPEGFNMLRYSGGQEYKSHYDGGSETGRCVSAIVYLNNDYEGGEIEFVNYGIKLKPEPGMLLLFPSNYAYAHIAHPVTDGTKYAIVTWLKDI